jgi:hypothetical protein
MKIKKPEWDNIDNKYELIAYLIKRHWWKVSFILITSGIMITGFTCAWKDISIHKDPIYQRSDKK